MTNSLPLPRPSLCASIGAAVQRDEAAHDRQAEPEAALRAIERLPLLREQVEDGRQQSRRRCRCRCPSRAARPGPPTRLAVTLIRPRGSVYFAALVSRFADDLREPRGVAVDEQAAARHVQLEMVLPLLEQRAGASRSPSATTSPSSTGSGRSSILPRVMRDTSSRSSTSRTRWRTWRSMTVRSRSAPASPRSASAAAPSGSARAGCAARGRASPGTRPWCGSPTARRRAARSARRARVTSSVTSNAMTEHALDRRRRRPRSG